MPLKNLFVREVEVTPKVKFDSQDLKTYPPMPDVIPPKDYSTMDIYVTAENSNAVTLEELFDTSNQSIYDVVPFIDGLPASMSMVDKQSLLTNMLKAAKHDIPTLKDNAVFCISSLESIESDLLKRHSDFLSDCEDEISELETKIAEIRAEMAEKTSTMEQQEKLIDDEINRIKTIDSHLL